MAGEFRHDHDACRTRRGRTPECFTECDAGPNVFLDGHLVNPSGMVFDINDIQPADMLAIELYRHVSEVPLKFGGSDAVCGAIVIWTKH